MSGKGDDRRPALVPEKQVRDSWARTFKPRLPGQEAVEERLATPEVQEDIREALKRSDKVCKKLEKDRRVDWKILYEPFDAAKRNR